MHGPVAAKAYQDLEDSQSSQTGEPGLDVIVDSVHKQPAVQPRRVQDQEREHIAVQQQRPGRVQGYGLHQLVYGVYLLGRTFAWRRRNVFISAARFCHVSAAAAAAAPQHKSAAVDSTPTSLHPHGTATHRRRQGARPHRESDVGTMELCTTLFKQFQQVICSVWESCKLFRTSAPGGCGTKKFNGLMFPIVV